MFDLANHKITYSAKDFGKVQNDSYLRFFKVQFIKLSAAITEYKSRKEIKKLLKATPDHLEDIGIKRAHLIAALKLPLNKSAGLWLNNHSRESILLKKR